MAITSATKAITSALNHSNLYGYSICHGNNISQTTKWLFHLPQSHYISCHTCGSIFHMVKTSAYNNMAIISAMVAITSTIYMQLTICHNTTDYYLLNKVASISHCIQVTITSVTKALLPSHPWQITSANNI